MPIIVAEKLTKSYQAAAKDPGFAGTLRHLFKRKYRTIEAVKAINFTIEPGEVVGFLGPNGAGKTTALKMLTGLLFPTSGRVEVAGHTPFRREKSFLRKITLVMGQKQQLIWDLPVLDSLRVNAAIYEIPEAEAKRRVDELAGMLGLDAQLKQPVRKLSLGERMKAELMAALLHKPDILFLDEPTLGLDVNAQVSVRKFLQEYNRKSGATVLLTSHYMADVTALCKRVVMIHQGSLIYDGSLEAIVERVAPYREVKLDLGKDYDAERLKQIGEVQAIEGRVVRLLVKRDDLTRTVSRAMNELEVTDLTVTDPPVEEIIGRVFSEGKAG